MKLKISENRIKTSHYGNSAESRRKEIADRFGKIFNPDDHMLTCKDGKVLNIQIGKKYRCTAFDNQKVEIVDIEDILDDGSAMLDVAYRNKRYTVASTQLYESKLREQDVEIEVKNKGILEVPEDKNVDDLPMSHFEKLVKKHGLSKITKALNNLQVWNKNDDKELSKWAGNMIDKLTKKFGKNESLLKRFNEDYIDGVYVDIDSLSERYRRLMRSGKLDDIIALYHEVGGDFDEFVIEALQIGFSKLDIMCFSVCNDGLSINNFKNRLRMLGMLDENLKEYYDAQDFNSGIEDTLNYDGSDMYDDILDEPYTEEDEFNYYVDYVYNHTRNPQEAKRYLRSEGKSKEYIDQVIAAVDEIYG